MPPHTCTYPTHPCRERVSLHLHLALHPSLLTSHPLTQSRSSWMTYPVRKLVQNLQTIGSPRRKVLMTLQMNMVQKTFSESQLCAKHQGYKNKYGMVPVLKEFMVGWGTLEDTQIILISFAESQSRGEPSREGGRTHNSCYLLSIY